MTLVLWYFTFSPFFDRTSNNGVLMSQAQFNPDMQHLIFNRVALEERLRSMNGVEYMIAQEPADPNPASGTGVYVIRKQRRMKRPGMEDEVQFLQSYFVIGDNIYQAPTVGDVLGSRLLSMASSLNSFISKASTLTEFSPALGHRYLPPPTNRSKTSTSASGQVSQAATPLPDSVASKKSSQTTANANQNEYLSSRLLEESFNLTLQYGEHYMDENPITGEPGSFHFRKKKPVPIDPAKLTAGNATSPFADGKGKADLVVDTKIDVPPPPTGRKGSKAEKSPKTPLSAREGGISKTKKRKSSKATGMGASSG